MKFDKKLLQGRLIKRYKRFFADVELDTGELVVAHCPNTGSMKNCLVENSPCWVSESDNPKRKLAYTLEAVTSLHGGMAGVNTGRANKLVQEALEKGVIEELSGYEKIRSEVRFGEEKSRLDFLLTNGDESSNRLGYASEGVETGCYVEVKNVTMGMPEGLGMFPDAVTTRGAKHLRELSLAKRQGYKAVLFFCVQHQGIDRVVPAREVDPEYYHELLSACDQGVEVLVYAVDLSRDEFVVSHRLPFDFG